MSNIPWQAPARFGDLVQFQGTLEQCVRRFVRLTNKEQALATVNCDELVTAPGAADRTHTLVGPEVSALARLLR